MGPEELQEIAAAQRQAEEQSPRQIRVCTAAGCLSAGAGQVKEALQKHAGECCKVKGVGCMGLCSAGPLVAVDPEGTLYKNVTAEDVPAIAEAVKDGKTVDRLVCD